MFANVAREGRPEQAGSRPGDRSSGTPRGACLRVRILTPGLVVAVVALAAGVDRMTGASSSEVAAFDACGGFGGFVRALTLSSDGRMAYACTSDGSLIAWEPGSPLSRTDACAATAQSVPAAWAANASALAVADRDDSVVLWDLEAGGRAAVASTVGPTHALAVSPEGSTLAVADSSGVRLLDRRSGALLAHAPIDGHDMTSLAVSSDGHALAAGFRDGTIRLWQGGDTEPRLAVRAHRGPVSSLAFAPGGAVLASANHGESDAKFWSVADGRLLNRSTCRSCIQVLAFAPSGRLLVTAGRDGSVQAWDTATPGRRPVVLPHDGPVSALAFSSDGTTLACGGVGSIRLYRVADITVQTP